MSLDVTGSLCPKKSRLNVAVCFATKASQRHVSPQLGIRAVGRAARRHSVQLDSSDKASQK